MSECELKCSECGGKIVIDDMLDREYLNGQYKENMLGHCEKCGQDYMRYEYYKYDHTDRLQKY